MEFPSRPGDADLESDEIEADHGEAPNTDADLMDVDTVAEVAGGADRCDAGPAKVGTGGRARRNPPREAYWRYEQPDPALFETFQKFGNMGMKFLNARCLLEWHENEEAKRRA